MGNGKLDILCQANLKVRIRGIVQVDAEFSVNCLARKKMDTRQRSWQ